MRNEFSKIFEDFFTMTLFTEMAHIYDQTKNLGKRPKVDFGDILKLVGYKLENYSNNGQISILPQAITTAWVQTTTLEDFFL